MSLGAKISLGIAVCVAACLIASVWIEIPADDLAYEPVTSTHIYDRHGNVLQRVLSERGVTAQRVCLADVPHHVKLAVIQTEDKRFYRHIGIDPIALGRAIWQLLTEGHAISGASTITQQLVRNLYWLPRTFPVKVYEMWLALRIEKTISKDKILEQYLNRISFANQVNGIGTAAEFYFQKPVIDLTLAEGAYLAAIPKSPTRYNPFRFHERIVKRQEKIIRNLLSNGLITDAEFDEAIQQPIRIVKPEHYFQAPHFCRAVINGIDNKEKCTSIYTTLDLDLQLQIQQFVRARLAALASHNAHNAAVLVVDNQNGNVLVWLGSSDYFDDSHAGQVDGVLALRQPGSTLKPFTYGLALENGMTAASIIPDIPLPVTPESPTQVKNYDEKFHGPVTVRRALACSYNVPAVRVVEQVGVATLLNKLHQAGFASLQQNPEFYGKGLTLGNGEVTLLELVRAYAALARMGTLLQIRALKNENIPVEGKYSKQAIFSPEICAILLNILDDDNARVPAFGKYNPLTFPFDCAVKTGTSKDYRDNWVVGCTPEVTVGVWVGNFSGEPMHNVSGITGAGPIFHDVMHLLDSYYQFSKFLRPESVEELAVCALSGKRPGTACVDVYKEWFIKGTAPQDTCTWHYLLKDGKVAYNVPMIYQQWLEEQGLRKINSIPDNDTADQRYIADTLRIIAPKDGDTYKLDPLLARQFQKIDLIAGMPRTTTSITWMIDDANYKQTHYPFITTWKLEPGVHTIRICADMDTSEAITINVIP